MVLEVMGSDGSHNGAKRGPKGGQKGVICTLFMGNANLIISSRPYFSN